VKKLHVWTATTIVVLLCIILIVVVIVKTSQAQLVFQVQDAVSQSWVWDMNASIQNKKIQGYFQSDNALIDYQFTGLKPGPTTLEISAPYYESVSIPLTLKRGENRISEPIALVGQEIPDLATFYAFERETPEGWSITVRPVTEGNYAVMLHPALDIWIGAKVSSWEPQLPQTLKQLEEQPILFRGELDWKWDAYPETQFRYIASLPLAKLEQSTATLFAIEYLILVPNPKKITNEEFKAITEDIGMMSLDKIAEYVDTLQGKVHYYTDISWDVRRSQ